VAESERQKEEGATQPGGDLMMRVVNRSAWAIKRRPATDGFANLDG
jgi:hypothetical protein